MTTHGERVAKTSWEGAGVYQIYPHTFNEVRQNNEPHRGEGSLRGIIEKRDYLHDLGVNAIWISPFYPSPMVDGGYDISDYEEIDPNLGTLDDFLELITSYHERDMKVMVDLVPNHTSDQHQWFQQSRRSRDNPKSDWYIWHDPAPGGGPPNNWSSVFSLPQLWARQRGELVVPDSENTPPLSAWTYNETRQQYYLHDFAVQQPNLNWHNPEVRETIKGVMRTWLDRGVDGFRVDVANHLGKNPSLADDDTPNPHYHEGIDNPHDQFIPYNALNYPDTLYPYLREMTSVLEEAPYADKDLRLILECWMPKEDLAKVDRVAPHLASSFNFTRLTAPWNAQTHKRLLDTYYADLPNDSVPNQVLSNHDVPRVASRLGRAALSAAVLNLTLPGTIFIYNGEEGGFTDVDVPTDRRQDSDLGGRDGARTPMLWDASKNAGFSNAHPDRLWLPIDPDYEQKNLAAQAQDPCSSFSLYRTLLHLRNKLDTLRHGSYYPLSTDNEDVIAFGRRHEDDQTITLINFSDQQTTTSVLDTEQVIGKIIVSSLLPIAMTSVDLERPISLQPNEGILIVRSC